MSNYYELQSELNSLLDARDSENNPQMQAEIDVHIAEVRGKLNNYPLADDDLFRCSSCQGVFDIEDSIETTKGLCCDGCVAMCHVVHTYKAPPSDTCKNECYKYVADHYRNYSAYPMDFEFEDVVYEYATFIAWFSDSELSTIEQGAS